MLSYTTPIFTATATGLIKSVERPTAINLWVFLNFFYIETLVLIFVVACLLALFFFAINLPEIGGMTRSTASPSSTWPSCKSAPTLTPGDSPTRCCSSAFTATAS